MTLLLLLVTSIMHLIKMIQSLKSVFFYIRIGIDNINYQIILKKVEYYGIRGSPLWWFRSYLSNRKQYDKYNRSDSILQDVTHSVTQWYILQLLVFVTTATARWFLPYLVAERFGQRQWRKGLLSSAWGVGKWTV